MKTTTTLILMGGKLAVWWKENTTRRHPKNVFFEIVTHAQSAMKQPALKPARSKPHRPTTPSDPNWFQNTKTGFQEGFYKRPHWEAAAIEIKFFLGINKYIILYHIIFSCISTKKYHYLRVSQKHARKNVFRRIFDQTINCSHVVGWKAPDNIIWKIEDPH